MRLIYIHRYVCICIYLCYLFCVWEKGRDLWLYERQADPPPLPSKRPQQIMDSKKFWGAPWDCVFISCLTMCCFALLCFALLISFWFQFCLLAFYAFYRSCLLACLFTFTFKLSSTVRSYSESSHSCRFWNYSFTILFGLSFYIYIH